jgi:hypothetical protein
MATKKQGNKKVVKAVSKAIRGTAKELKVLQNKSMKAMKVAQKKWKSTEPKRTELKASAKKLAKKIEKESGVMYRKSVQLEKDIAKGVKLGIKHSKNVK